MILVTGGTGAVGSKLVEMLLSNEQPVRIIIRGHGDWKQSSMPQFRKTGVDVVVADMRDQTRLEAAVEGCQAIVNLGAAMRSTPDESVESVNMEAVVNLVAIAEARGVQRFIHVSCLGATQHSGCRYFTSKWASETIVKSAQLYWTIFRPSLIFGDDSHMMNILGYWVNRFPVIPVIGSGLNRIQPVSSEDVAAAILQSIYNKDSAYKIYDLVGPTSYSLTELLEMMADWQGITKKTVNIPSDFTLKVLSFLSRYYPNMVLDEEIVKIMTTDMVGDPSIMQTNFKVPMLTLAPKTRQINRNQNWDAR